MQKWQQFSKGSRSYAMELQIAGQMSFQNKLLKNCEKKESANT